MALNVLGLGLLFTAKDLATGVMAKVRNGFSESREEVEKFKEGTKHAFKQFAVGTAMMTAGLVGLAVLGSTIDEAAEFGKAIALVRTEVDEATFSQEAMKDITIDLGKQFGKLPKDEAEALYKAVALGANTAAKSTSLMTSANQLAVAGNSELSVTMNALGGTLNAYHMDMSRAAEVSDAMFTAMKGGNTTVGDIAGAIGKVAPGAYEMGISLQELLGSMAVMTNKGIQASEAVSGLHGALANIVHPSADATAEATRLGIKFDAAAVRAQGFTKFMHSIVDNAKFGKDTLSKLFTSVEGSNAMAMLAGDMGSVDAIMKSMQEGAGATAQGFAVMTETIAFQGDRFKALFSALKIRVGEFLEPLAARGLGIINRLMDAFTSLPGPVQGTIVHIALAAASIVTLVGAMTAGIAMFRVIAVAMTGFGAAASGSVVAAIAPAILAIGALAAAGYGLKVAWEQNLGDVQGIVRSAVEGIQLAFTALSQLFTQGGFSGEVRDAFKSGENEGIFAFAIRVYLVVGRVKAFLSSLADSFTAFVTESSASFTAFFDAIEGIGDAFSALWDTIDPTEAGAKFDLFQKIGAGVGTVLGFVVRTVANLATVVMNIVQGILEGALEPLWDLGGEVIDALGGVFSAIGEIATELGMLDNSVDGSAGGWVAFGRTLGNVVGFIANVVKSLVRTVGGALSSVVNVLGGIVDIFSGNVEKGINRILYGIVSLISGVVLGAIELVAQASDALLGTSFADKFKGYRADLDKSLRYGFNIEQRYTKDEAPVPSPAPTTDPALLASTSPMLMSMGGGENMSVDPQVVADAAAAAAEAAAKASPPTVVHSVLTLPDGTVLAESVSKAQTSSDARSFTPSMPDVG